MILLIRDALLIILCPLLSDLIVIGKRLKHLLGPKQLYR